MLSSMLRAFVAALMVIVVAGASISDLPQCAQSALLPAILQSKCQLGDTNCICQDPAMLGLQSSLQASCSADDQQKAAQIAAQACPNLASLASSSAAAPATSEAPASSSDAAPAGTETSSSMAAESSSAAPASTEMSAGSSMASSTEMSSGSTIATTSSMMATGSASMTTVKTVNGTITGLIVDTTPMSNSTTTKYNYSGTATVGTNGSYTTKPPMPNSTHNAAGAAPPMGKARLWGTVAIIAGMGVAFAEL